MPFTKECVNKEAFIILAINAQLQHDAVYALGTFSLPSLQNDYDALRSPYADIAPYNTNFTMPQNDI